MSQLFVIWAADKNSAMARFQQLQGSEPKARILRRDDFDLVQAEDLDRKKALANAGSGTYGIVVELP